MRIQSQEKNGRFQKLEKAVCRKGGIQCAAPHARTEMFFKALFYAGNGFPSGTVGRTQIQWN
jgi:hypothetical protein